MDNDIYFLNNISTSIRLNEDNEKKDYEVTMILLKEIAEVADTLINQDQKERHVSKSGFNIFECLTRHHLEELHSGFIAYLLNPKGSHDCGNLFLELFIETIKEKCKFSQNLIEYINNGSYVVTVKREKYFRVSNELFGFIDIFIEFPNYVIAIENKIYAKEQNRQIERYAKFCNELNKENKIIYLTRKGASSMEAGEEAYISISYKNEICEWLDKCIYKCIDYPHIYSNLNSYKDLVKKKILNLDSTNTIMKLREILLKEDNKLILKYFADIQEAIIEVRDHLRHEFFQNVYKSLNEKGFKFYPRIEGAEKCSISEIWDGECRGFRCYDVELVLEIPNEERIIFYLEHNYESLYYGLTGVKSINNGDQPIDICSYEISTEIEYFMLSRLNYSLEEKEEYWLAWKFFDFFESNEDFNSDGLNYEFATNMNFIVNQFVNEIIGYLSAWKDCINEINKLRLT